MTNLEKNESLPFKVKTEIDEAKSKMGVLARKVVPRSEYLNKNTK